MIGVKEYRDGDETAKFKGDPIPAIYAELVDSSNYNDEARNYGFELHSQFDEILRNLAKLLKLYRECEVEKKDETTSA